jgi:tetratricopeptide (TPR) repeat protein
MRLGEAAWNITLPEPRWGVVDFDYCPGRRGLMRCVDVKFGLLVLVVAAWGQSLDELRNLGKAFYENPTTQKEAVEVLKRAWDASPGSARERLNYGLALLRAGRNAEAVEVLLAVQKVAPEIPHTWFTLGVEYKKQGEAEKALAQMLGAKRLDPREPMIRYNLGVLHKQLGDAEKSIAEFEAARDLDAGLAGARFQLFNAYRQAGRPADAQRELAVFQRLKKESEGAAVPEDVDWSQYSEIYDPAPRRPAPDTRELKWTSRALPYAVEGALALGRRLLTWDSKGVRVNGVLGPRVAGVKSVGAGDFNNDGVLDLCVAAEDWAFVGRSTLKKVAEGRFSRCVWLDFDHDYDLDLFLLGETSVLLRNQGAAGFADYSKEFPFVEGQVVDAVAFRKVADTRGFDLVVSYSGRKAVLYRDKLLGKYAVEDFELPAGAKHLVVGDFDANGQLEISHGDVGRVFADFRNSGQPELVEGFVALDRNADGKLDLIARGAKGIEEKLNATVTANRSVRIELTGVKNLKTALGAEVEVKIGGLYQKRRYEGAALLIGVGAATRIDVVRITWPNGLIQNEMRQSAGRPLVFREAQRLSGSCPIIWTWNGSEFEYVTDVLGVAPLGASAGDGTYFPTDSDEYVYLSGEQLRPNARGNLEVRMTEELSEAAYFDRVRLLAVDHPAALSVFTNEKWKAPPFPTFRLFGVRERMAPEKAVDDAGRDVREALLRRDKKHPDAFSRTSAGVAQRHELTLDFGNAAAANDAVLVLFGWVDWADGSTFLAQAQTGTPLQAPYLQVRDAHGRWVTVVEDMGMPSGKPKAIAVDLKGKFLSASREVRIVTNLCVYWDEIFLGESSAAPEHRMAEAKLVAADLRFRGFAGNKVHPERKQAEEFFYANPTPISLWNPTPGMYTAYGDVWDLIAKVDEELVTMGSGDEVALEFEAASLPRLPEGWRRDYLLHVDGWAKDRDANTAFSQTVEPLPFRSMPGYPYPGEAPRAKRNTRPALVLLRSLVN